MANKSPEVSVIFPVYNVQSVVAKSLRSVLDQSFRDFEIIIIDDAGADDSISIIKEVISEYKEKPDISILTHDTNKGLSEARNTGIRNAKGKYLFFVDSDDELPNDALSLHYQAIERHKADFTDANFRMIGHHDIFAPYKENLIFDGNDNVLEAFFSILHVSACNKLVRRSLIIDNAIYFVGGMLYEDMCWLLAVAKASRRCVCLPDETYDYIIRQDSITRAEDKKKLYRRIESYKKMLTQADMMTRGFDSPALAAAADKWFVKTMVRVKYNVVRMPLEAAEKKDFFRWCTSLRRSAKSIYGIFNSLSTTMFRIVVANAVSIIRRS